MCRFYSLQTYTIKGFLKYQQRSGETHNEKRLRSEQTEDHTLHCCRHDQLRNTNQPLCLLTWQHTDKKLTPH